MVVLPARYLSSAPSPSSQVARWRGSSGAWLPFSILLWGRSHSEDDGKGAGMGLPIGLFLFQLERLPCFCTSGSGQWMQSLAGMSVLWDGYLVPFQDSSLPLLRSLLSLQCSGCACLGLRPCGKCLSLCLQKVPQNRPRSWSWLSSRLFLVERFSDRLASRDRFLSPGRMCLARSVHDGVSRFGAVSVREWAFLAPLGLTVDCCRVPWRCSSRKLLRFP